MEANDLKVVVIADTPESMAALKSAVAEALPGCTLLAAKNGTKGIELARAHDADAILLDIEASGKGGYGVCRKLKADERTRDTAVVFLLPSRAGRDSRVKAMEAGADALLSKPVVERELAAQIRAMAKVKAASRPRRHVPSDRAVEALRESEFLYRSLFDNMLNGFALCQMLYDGERPQDFIYLAVNKAFEKQTGLTDVTGKRVSVVIPGIREADPDLFDAYGRVARTGKPEHIELLVRALRMWFSISIYSPKRDFFVAVFDVITERKQWEKTLRESEEKHRRLFETMAQGVVYQAADGRIISANPAAERILGLTLDQMMGKTSMDPGWKAVREDGADLDGQDHPAMVALRTGKPVEQFIMGVFNPRTSTHSWLSVTAIPILQPGEKTPSQVYTTFDEITEHRRVEQALRDGEAFTRAVLDHLPVGIAVNSVAPAVASYMNDNFPRLYRTTREKLADPDVFWEVVYEDAEFRERMKKRVLDDCASGDVERMCWTDVPITRKGEETTYITARNTPVPGKPLMISSVWDVTDRKRAEEALRHRDLLLRQTQQISRVGGWELEVETGNLTWTDETYRLYGVSPDDYDPNDLSRDVAFYEDRETIDRAFRRAVELGESYDLELGFRNARGESLWVRTIGNSEVKDGKVVRVFGSIMDITEQKRAETEHERLMAAIEQTGEVVYVTDAQGIIQYVNPALEAVSGYSRDEAIGRIPTFLNSGEQDDAFYQELYQTISSGKTWQGTLRHRRKDGKLYTEDATISPVSDAGGRIVSYVGVSRDTTAQRQFEDRLRQSQKMETVGQLAGGVAHDFNNMLQVITSYTEMSLTKVGEDQPLRKYLQEIRRAAKRSAEITGQLLAFARKQTVSPKVLDLNETVSNTQKMIQRLIGEDIDLVWMPGHGLWQVKIDPAQLDQILANLAVNARDAIGGVGKLTIETENVSFDEAYCAAHGGYTVGEYVLLAVSDDGSGMDKETMSHLFEPFFTTKEPGKGTGLGLATIYGIVKQNNGFINAYSEPGHGTTFKVYLPRVEPGAVPVGVEAQVPMPRGGTETVLVVEDEGAILELAKEILEQFEYRVLAARSPAEALRKSEEHVGPIHLLITDVVMPQMNGRQLAQRLSAERPGLKCLYMSGYTADVIAHRGVLEEGVSFIAKPFSLATLALKVREVLDSPRGCLP